MFTFSPTMPHGLTGMILGHSFVAGTLHHLSPASHPSSQRTASLFRVNKTVPNLKLYGERGARVTHPNFTLPDQALRHYKPSFAILEYGTNDIVFGADPLDIATTIIDIANELLSTYSVYQVYICSILNRTGSLHSITPHYFKSQAFKINHYLSTMCKDEPNLHFHVHKGFWSIPPHKWTRDGVHPNTKEGRSKYISSLRKAIFLAVGKLCQMSP